MSLRARNKARRRQRILEAARALIVERGAEGWSMRKVASRAGVSVTTLYNLFGSKEEIRAALCGDLLDGVDRDLADAPLDRPLERARAVVSLGVDHVVASAAITRPALLAAGRGPADETVTPRAVEMQRAAIQAGVDRGLLRDELRPDLLAAQVYEGFLAAAQRWAEGELDAAGFRCKALYSLHVCLLAACTEEARGGIVASLRALEPKIAALPERAA